MLQVCVCVLRFLDLFLAPLGFVATHRLSSAAVSGDCRIWGLCRLLTVVSSLVAKERSNLCGLSSCGTRA